MLLSQIHNSELYIESKTKLYGIITTSTTLLNFALTFFFLSVLDLDWRYRIIALLLIESIMLFFRYCKKSNIYSEFQFIIDYGQFKYFLSYGLPLVLNVISAWLINKSDRFFLLNFFSLKEVGYYTAAGGIASFIGQINNNLIKAVYPSIFNRLKVRNAKMYINKITKIYSIFILLLSLTFSTFIFLLGKYFLGESYLKAFPIMILLCVAQAISGIYMISSLTIDYFKESHIKTLIAITSSVFLLLITLALIPIIGYYAPAVGTIFSYVILVLLTRIYTLKILYKNEVS